MSNSEWLSNLDYTAIISLLKTAASTLENGVVSGNEHAPLRKNEVKNIVNKLTEQLNLLIEEEKSN